MHLYITIADGSGRRQSFCVRTSPMRLGRSPLNDMVVDFPFVSQFHGVVRFDEHSVTYVDLGSRNSTRIDGEIVPADKPVLVRASSELQIGPLQLMFVTGPATGFVDENWPYFGETDERPRPGSAPDPRQTLVLPPEQRGAAKPEWPARHLPPEVAPPPLARPRAPAPAPAPKPPATLADRLSALIDRPENRDDVELIMGLAEIAEVAARSAIALRSGDESVGDEMGIRTVHQAGSGASRTSRELLDHLLFGEGRRASRLRELATTFSDAAIHQVALLNAMRHGLESFLAYLHPATGGFVTRKSGGTGLKEYTAFFDEQVRDPWPRVLGDSFVQAYAVATDERATGREDYPGPVACAPQSETAFFDGPPPAPAAAPRGALLRLVVTSSELNGAEFVLQSGVLSVGRTEDNAICLPHRSVSSRHALVAQEGGMWTISDQNSTNGIVVNGTRTARAALSPGDTIQIGRVQLRVAAS